MAVLNKYKLPVLEITSLTAEMFTVTVKLMEQGINGLIKTINEIGGSINMEEKVLSARIYKDSDKIEWTYIENDELNGYESTHKKSDGWIEAPDGSFYKYVGKLSQPQFAIKDNLIVITDELKESEVISYLVTQSTDKTKVVLFDNLVSLLNYLRDELFFLLDRVRTLIHTSETDEDFVWQLWLKLRDQFDESLLESLGENWIEYWLLELERHFREWVGSEKYNINIIDKYNTIGLIKD